VEAKIGPFVREGKISHVGVSIVEIRVSYDVEDPFEVIHGPIKRVCAWYNYNDVTAGKQQGFA
jgi:hypothetical protein